MAASGWASPVPRAGWVTLILLPAFLGLPGVVERCWRREEDRRRGLRALALAVAGVALWSLIDWLALGSPRPAMPLGHHNLLAAWLVILLPLAVLPAREPGRWRFAGLAAGGLAAAAILASRSLAGCAALAAAALLAFGAGPAARAGGGVARCWPRAARPPRPAPAGAADRLRGGSLGPGPGRLPGGGDRGVPGPPHARLGSGLGAVDGGGLPRSDPAGEPMGRVGRGPPLPAGPARLRVGPHRPAAGRGPDRPLLRPADRRARGGAGPCAAAGRPARPRRRRRGLARQRRAGGDRAPPGRRGGRRRGARGQRPREGAELAVPVRIYALAALLALAPLEIARWHYDRARLAARRPGSRGGARGGGAARSRVPAVSLGSPCCAPAPRRSAAPPPGSPCARRRRGSPSLPSGWPPASSDARRKPPGPATPWRGPVSSTRSIPSLPTTACSPISRIRTLRPAARRRC